MPEHRHTYGSMPLYGWDYSSGGAIFSEHSSTSNGPIEYSTSKVGGNQPHENMPPYKAVYIWERTA